MEPNYEPDNYVSFNNSCYSLNMNFDYVLFLESAVCILAEFIYSKYCQ